MIYFVPEANIMRATSLVAVFWLGVLGVETNAAEVCVAKVDGTIGPATAGYLSRSVDEAEARSANCLIVELNTPGGLLQSTQTIVQKFLGSKTPIVVFVTPMGGTAASAGCFITLSADIAAMAPATTIGAAHPVTIGGAPGGDQPKPDDTMAKKLENFAASYIEAIAVKRGRNVEWARSAVLQSASITADEARKLNVIQIIANDRDDLLRQLNGRVVRGMTLATDHARVVRTKMTPAEQVFQLAWKPEVMFILMLVAIYGLIAEVTSPGAILPGVAGSIALVLALYMAAVLPVNLAGLLLIGLAVGLFMIDVFAPTHGILTAGGIISFLIGSMMLFNRSDPVFRLSLGYIIPATVVTAAFFIFVVGKGLRAQRLPIKVGTETMLGKIVQALTPIDASGGKIVIEGEYWNATSETPVDPGQSVQITAVEGLTVKVKPKMQGA
jgi:membrane-bound serine protease (ClpP class)